MWVISPILLDIIWGTRGVFPVPLLFSLRAMCHREPRSAGGQDTNTQGKEAFSSKQKPHWVIGMWNFTKPEMTFLGISICVVYRIRVGLKKKKNPLVANIFLGEKKKSLFES